jgi:hypothetical protein
MKNKINSLILITYISTLFLIVQTSNSIPTFVDEIVAIGSTFNILSTLDFNAAPLLSGSFSVGLTTGPLSSVGGVIGWLFTKDLLYSRIFNFFYVLFFLIIIFNLLVDKKLKLNIQILMPFLITLIPWWYGVLYSIGEIISMYIFILGILILKDKSHISYLLFGISLILCKFASILPISLFLIIYVILTKKLIIKDLIFFLFPFILWGILASLSLGLKQGFYSLFDIFLYHLFHEGSGVDSFSFKNILYLIQQTEVSQWSVASYLRILIAPVVFYLYIVRNYKILSTKFDHLIIPLLISNFGTYLWFWIISPKKYMRYSHHFIVPIIFFTIIFLITNVDKDKLDYIILLGTLSLFLSSPFIMLVFVLIGLNLNKKNILYFLIIFMTLNNLNLIYENRNKNSVNMKFNECSIYILENKCLEKYLPYLN